ncbi:Piso0_003332 [Millerozyma farinosa CBS 7064]|uniref:Piso0_003332 protein n=1 Tax=Pichia sorbitophila (strain ATCC MYA-4447 / BCRC 22081 / CBS 7064 / NBRC 10061 / NRRL Y-12695) TaxID=559304 RepID=G8YIT5_PICSO|nr:Piso0_003332 [Millerozyma farinosa CBS 7064]CCE80995.1 Piso0_003332 [Millerozyma farinosa CBS 7064]
METDSAMQYSEESRLAGRAMDDGPPAVQNGSSGSRDTKEGAPGSEMEEEAGSKADTDLSGMGRVGSIQTLIKSFVLLLVHNVVRVFGNTMARQNRIEPAGIQASDSGEQQITEGSSHSNNAEENTESDASVVVLDVKTYDPEATFESYWSQKMQQHRSKSPRKGQYGTSLRGSVLNSDYGRHVYTDPSQRALTYYEDSGTGNRSILDTGSYDYDAYVSKFYLPREPIARDKYSVVGSLIENITLDDISGIEENRKHRRDLISKERESAKSFITPLSSDQEQLVNKYWRSPPYTFVVSGFQIEITSRDLQTLKYGNWLNDNIIDFYFNLITEKNPRVYGWTTHFFTTLKQKGYQSVARWAKRRKLDVTAKDIILVPVNIMGTHWALAVINNIEKRFQYFDSLSSRGNMPALQLLRTYMKEEGKKLGSSINFESYEIQAAMPSPQQNNGSDCGVFTCVCANYISRGKQLTYSQKDMKIIRKNMAYEIITKNLLH